PAQIVYSPLDERSNWRVVHKFDDVGDDFTLAALVGGRAHETSRLPQGHNVGLASFNPIQETFAPTLKQRTLLVSVLRQVVMPLDTPNSANVAESRLDDVRQGQAELVSMGRKRSAQIVRGPLRQRLACCLGDARVEPGLGLAPSGKPALALAEYEIPGRTGCVGPARLCFDDLACDRCQKDFVTTFVFDAIGRQHDRIAVYFAPSQRGNFICACPK